MKVQCQRTRRYLIGGSRRAGGVWTCPFCQDGETYRQVELFDQQLCDVVLAAIQEARQLFRRPHDGKETRIWLGDSPETTWEPREDAFHLYLSSDSDWFQHNYQGAHEAFHRVCSPCDRRGHWVDEMLAVMFSLHHLRLVDMEDYAENAERNLTTQGQTCSVEQLVGHDGSFPDGIYGRCFLIGQELLEVVDWEGLIELNDIRTDDQTPDVARWLTHFSRQTRKRLQAIVTP